MANAHDIPPVWELPPDRMTGPERMQALLTPGVRPDRVPFIPFIFGFTTRNCGWELADVYRDPERSFVAQMRSLEQYGYDGGALYGYASAGAWEFGGEIKWPLGEWDQAPTVTRHPVESEDDVDRIGVPDDVSTAGAVPIMMAFSKLQEQAGMPVTVQLGSAFTNAGNMVAPSTLLKWMVRKPDLAHHLIGLQRDFLLKVAKLWTDTFPGRMIMGFDGGPTEANALISPQQFKEFAFAYSHEIHEKALAMGVTHFHTHACGEQNANLPFYADMEFGHPGGPPGMMSFGHEVDLTRAIEMVGDKVVVMGNVEPAEIQMSPPEKVWELTKTAVLKGKEAPVGYVLMAGCEVPVNAPPYNIFTMLKACKAFGQYD
jgi:uroporphyrinogen decarboxylase